MATKKLQEMSNEKLLEQKKSIGFLTGVLIGALVTLLAFTLYTSINQGFTPLLVVPLALSPIVFLNLTTLKAIKKEIQARNEVV